MVGCLGVGELCICVVREFEVWWACCVFGSIFVVVGVGGWLVLGVCVLVWVVVGGVLGWLGWWLGCVVLFWCVVCGGL